MNILYSLWTKNDPKFMIHYPTWQLSVALAQKHYGDINLITDDTGSNLLKNIPFKNIYVQLNNVPDFKNIWSLGKIYAYRFACSIGKPFLHIDHDVFLWEKLPQNLIDSEVFCQSNDFLFGASIYYDIRDLDDYLNSYLAGIWHSNIGTQCYNMGIFGGQNLEFINDYCDFVRNMIEDESLTNLWKSNKTDLSCIVEQGHFGIYCKKHKIRPKCLFEERDDPNNETYKKYSHMGRLKSNPQVLDKISERISTLPYDLEPRDVPIEAWH